MPIILPILEEFEAILFVFLVILVVLALMLFSSSVSLVFIRLMDDVFDAMFLALVYILE